MKAMKENNFIELRMFECLYRTFCYARTAQVKMPVISKRKNGQKLEFKDVDVNVTKNKCGMRGHIYKYIKLILLYRKVIIYHNKNIIHSINVLLFDFIL